jgi:membrane-associated protease RseP (regulator of RpoE activity)
MKLITLTALTILVATAMAKGDDVQGKPTSKPHPTPRARLDPTRFAVPLPSLQTKTYQGFSTQAVRSFSKPASDSETGLVPRFGFESSFGRQNDCLGEHVTRVELGSPASRLGLVPGDAIVGVNGKELESADGWFGAIRRAAEQEGWVTLKIVEGRSGKVAYRTTNLFQLDGR